MKEVSRDESKQIMMDILCDVADFCDSHNLCYFLSSGTLIGAVRHKGFIPWDDDIDIDMPRPSYEKFIELYRKEGKYELCSPYDKNSFHFFTKVYDSRTVKYEEHIDYKRYSPLGIDIDVFPIDGLPSKKYIWKYHLMNDIAIKLYHIQYIYRHDGKQLSFKSRIIRPFIRMLPKHSFIYLYGALTKMYPFEKSSMVGFLSFFESERYKLYHAKSIYSEKVKVEFEGKSFWAPKGYDEYLRNIYGDYMQLPPIECQKTHHLNNLFWK